MHHAQAALPLSGGKNLAEEQLHLQLPSPRHGTAIDPETGQMAFPEDLMGASTRTYEIDWLSRSHPAVQRLGRLVEDVADQRQDEATVRGLLISAIKRKPCFAGKMIDRLLNEALAESVERAQALMGVASEALEQIATDDAVSFDDITDAECYALQEFLLTRSLHTLMDNRCGDDVRLEVWQWVLGGLLDHEQHFGFHQCCIAANADPEELFDRLEYMTRNCPWRFAAMDPNRNRALAAQLL